jgi:hypothetical protein
MVIDLSFLKTLRKEVTLLQRGRAATLNFEEEFGYRQFEVLKKRIDII